MCSCDVLATSPSLLSPFSLLALLSLLLPPPISPTSFALTFWLAVLVGRPARWLYLFVLIADGLLAGCGIRCLASTTCGPSVYLSLVHVACLSFSLFFVCDTCASFQLRAKTLLFVEIIKRALFPRCLVTPPKLPSFALSLHFCCSFLAHWWICHYFGAGSARGVNCLFSHIARDGRDPHLFGMGCRSMCDSVCLSV